MSASKVIAARKLCILTFLLLAPLLIARGQSKEELLKNLDKPKPDTILANNYIDLSTWCMSSNIDSARLFARKGIELAEKTGYLKGMCLGNLQLGIVYQNTGKYKEANTYFFKALKYAEQMANGRFKVQIFNSIANACSYQKMWDQALTYYNKAIVMADSLGMKSKKATLLMNMGNVAYAKGFAKAHFDESLRYFDSSLKIAEAIHDTNLLSSLYGNYALVYTDAKRFPEALKMIDKGMQLSQAMGAEEDYIFHHYYAGRAYSHMKEFDKAEYHFKESLKYAKKLENLDYQSENYMCMAEMYDDMKDYKNAYACLMKHQQLEDTLINDETTRQLNELKTIYETEKKEQEILHTREKLSAQDARLKTILISSVIGVLLLLVLIFFIYSRYQLKRKANKKLESAYGIIEEKQKDITDSINYAQKIQYAILPGDEEINAAFAGSFVLFRPRDVVSGDFYWFHATEQQVMVAAADCTGHGVPGALMSMIGSSLLNQIILEVKVNATGEILDLLRQGIKSAFKQKQGENRRRDGMDIGLLSFSKDRKRLQFSGANNGVYYVRNGEIRELQPDKQPVGQHEGEEKPFASVEMDVQPGDCFYLYTDGFADQFGGEKGKKFKYSKLKELLLEISSLPMAEQKARMEKVFNDWKGIHEQVDDVLIIGIRV
jgi:serine phosphatase RsbU (regulator of sigma subunit)